MISVCIATYNGAQFVRQQLESILPQLAPSDEVIVSDDGGVAIAALRQSTSTMPPVERKCAAQAARAISVLSV